MPRRVDYADRVEAIREVAYDLVLERGADALDIPAVAERLVMSPRTVQRLLASARALPHLALQRADRLERNRFLRRSRYPSWQAEPASSRALTLVLEKLPGQEDILDRDVWWRLVLAHPTTEWAARARAECDAELTELTADALSGIDDEDHRSEEATRLHVLAIGAVAQICLGTMTYGRAEQLLRCHVAEVLAKHEGAAAA